MSSKKVSAHDVFTVFENGGGWPSTTVSVFVGLLGSVFATYGKMHSFLAHDKILRLTLNVQVPTALSM